MLSQKIKAPRGRLPAVILPTGAETWTNREKIILIEAIQALGNEDWNEVSKFVHDLTKNSRTKEWCSGLNCSRQFQSIMETTGRQIRKRGDVDLLPAVRQHYVNERLQELQILAEDQRTKYMNLTKFNKEVEEGKHDDRVEEILAAYGSNETWTEPAEEESSSGLFYFAELSDLQEKISLINAFIQEEMGEPPTPAFPSTSGGPSTSADASAAPQAPGISGEDDEDLTDLMDILPNMETFDTDDIDATIMDTSEFEMMSPPDANRSLSSDTMRKAGMSTSPKVSPQLKNLVRTAIAGTAEEERPRNVTPSAGAPTLSLLLEMPPRDPGQPLPEISRVSKAAAAGASSLLDQPRQERMSPFRSATATLEQLQLNIALAKSPTRHQDSPTKCKSSSPTLQRLLEAPSIKKEAEDRGFPGLSFIPDLKIKDEADAAMAAATNIICESVLSPVKLPSTPSSTIPETSLPIFASPPAPPAEVVAEVAVSAAPSPEIKLELNEAETPSSAALPSTSVAKPPVVEAAKEVVEIKEEEEELPKPDVSKPVEEAVEILPLPPDVQDKVNNLTDLVIIQNTGIITPKASPAKDSSSKPTDEAKVSEVPALPHSTPVKTPEDTAVAKPVDSVESKVETDQVSMDVSETGEPGPGSAMPVLTPVPPTPSTTVVTKDAKPAAKAEPMEEDGSSSSLAEEEPDGFINPNAEEEDEELPDISGDESDKLKVRQTVKTYGRTSFRERSEYDYEDDNSNPPFESGRKISSPSRGSPARTSKSPTKVTSVPERKHGPGRRPGRPTSESSAKQQTEAESAAEEETRITRARSKPGSPLKAPKPGTSRSAAEPEPPSDTPPIRVTRNRASVTVPTQPSGPEAMPVLPAPPRKPALFEEKDHISHEIEPPAPSRATRQRISSTTKLSESHSGHTFEMEPSSPCSSTATSSHTDEDKEQKAFKKSICILWDQIKSHKHAGQFLKPITDTVVPNYNKKVYRPMDLTTIKRHIDSGIIRNIQSFERDVYLMLMNAIMYNSSDHEIHQRTVEMEHDVREMLESHKAFQKTTQSSEGGGSEGGILRSPVKLRSSARRVNKISDSDADEVNPEDGSGSSHHHGFHTPASASDAEIEDWDGSSSRHATATTTTTTEPKSTRESSPDITSAVSCSSGHKRRSRTSSPTSGHLAITSAAATGKLIERAASTDWKPNRQHSPDVNSPHP